MLLLLAGYPTLTPSGRGRQDFSMTQDQRTVFTHHVSLLEAYKPLDLASVSHLPSYFLSAQSISLYSQNICHMFFRIKMLKCKMCLIIQISLSHNTFYIFWTNAPAKSMLIQITQQLLSIDLAGPPKASRLLWET